MLKTQGAGGFGISQTSFARPRNVEENETVRVAVRCRPINEMEQQKGDKVVANVHDEAGLVVLLKENAAQGLPPSS